MSRKLLASVFTLILLTVPVAAEKNSFEWDPPELRTYSLLLGIAAGVVVEISVLSFGGYSYDVDPPPPALDGVAHTLPTAAVAFSSSILAINNYFRWTITGTEKWYGFVIKGTLLGGAAGTVATVTTFAVDGVTASLISDMPFNVFGTDALFWGALAVVPSAILGGLTGLVLYLVLPD